MQARAQYIDDASDHGGRAILVRIRSGMAQPPACESLGIPYPTSVRAKIHRVQLGYGGSFGMPALPFRLIKFHSMKRLSVKLPTRVFGVALKRALPEKPVDRFKRRQSRSTGPHCLPIPQLSHR